VRRVLAAEGSQIATLFNENRTRIPLDQMSPNIKNAIVAIEDYRFYRRGGIDPEGIFRALAVDAAGGHQDASTLTEPYVTMSGTTRRGWWAARKAWPLHSSSAIPYLSRGGACGSKPDVRG